ncbi:MAG: hypothetical protein IPI00_01955 [Flavobacteriales bacterium]|nr:hypothetical protein [Flavobacteriales bacterium]MBK6946107.1 hypothetical protein [Flavobacteriales bacterium]MBK7238948.1 hypothetical protein [Flavobacteriales bacterium]MBK7296870.1 hypothetical protein [Flavobacteriales bacterium]MBK9536938.1 hypothetical protein [Flavobacteriales bacterium]
MNWKGFLLDHMGYFSVTDIPNFLFAILLAGLLVFISARFGLRSTPADMRVLVIWAALVALGVGLVKGQLAFALVFVGVLLFARGTDSSKQSGHAVLMAMIIGFGCGSGAGLITFIAVLPLILILRVMKASS